MKQLRTLARPFYDNNLPTPAYGMIRKPPMHSLHPAGPPELLRVDMGASRPEASGGCRWASKMELHRQV